MASTILKLQKFFSAPSHVKVTNVFSVLL